MSNLIVKNTLIPGCFELQTDLFKDQRGSFVKIFNEKSFKEHQLETQYKEEYYTISRQGVLRGLHFQIPPEHCTKIVRCLVGGVLDAIVDLRIGSPAYGKFQSFKLNSDDNNMLYLPPGIAHGFYVMSEKALMLYKVSREYAPEHDKGIRWDSLGIPWPSKSPIVSERDQKFPSFANFVSPFEYK